METKVLFHGTDFEGMQGILKEGFQSNEKGRYVWNDSEPNAVYFYDLEKMGDDRDECIRQAFGNAQISAAVHGSLSKKVYVIELEIDAELTSDDESYENGSMAKYANYVMTGDLENVRFIVHEFPEGYEPGLRFDYLLRVKRNSIYMNDFSDIEQAIYDNYEKGFNFFDTEVLSMQECFNLCHDTTMSKKSLYVLEGLDSGEGLMFHRDILEGFAMDYFMEFDCRHNANKYPDMGERIGQFIRGGSYYYTDNMEQMRYDMAKYFGNDTADWDDYYKAIGSEVYNLLERFAPETYDNWLNK